MDFADLVCDPVWQRLALRPAGSPPPWLPSSSHDINACFPDCRPWPDVSCFDTIFSQASATPPSGLQRFGPSRRPSAFCSQPSSDSSFSTPPFKPCRTFKVLTGPFFYPEPQSHSIMWWKTSPTSVAKWGHFPLAMGTCCLGPTVPLRQPGEWGCDRVAQYIYWRKIHSSLPCLQAGLFCSASGVILVEISEVAETLCPLSANVHVILHFAVPSNHITFT